MAKEFLDIVGLQTYKTKYDEEIKAYIKTKEVGLTEDDVKGIINEVDNNIKISEDNT